MAPPGGEIVERLLGLGELTNPKGPQCVWRARRRGARPVSWADAGRLGGAQLPVGQPVMHPVQAVRIVQLRGHHRRHAQGDQSMTVLAGQLPQYPQQRQIGRRPRLVEPFLAHGPAAVVGQPREMGVQHQGEQTGHLATGRLIHERTAMATTSRLSSTLRTSAWAISKSAVVTAATSASSSTGQGASATARAIWASMIEPPCRASISASRGPWKTPLIDTDANPASTNSSVSSPAFSSRV